MARDLSEMFPVLHRDDMRAVSFEEIRAMSDNELRAIVQEAIGAMPMGTFDKGVTDPAVIAFRSMVADEMVRRSL